jgi:hypothetical protein
MQTFLRYSKVLIHDNATRLENKQGIVSCSFPRYAHDNNTQFHSMFREEQNSLPESGPAIGLDSPPDSIESIW